MRAHAARGSGLGLFIAKGIVDAHGKSIGVASRPGEGSDFFFTVPRRARPEARAEAKGDAAVTARSHAGSA